MSSEHLRCDIIIKNAMVIDGTASAPFEADLAVKGQNIWDVGRIALPSAGTVIDVGGCVVPPGFIDMHSHADFSLPVHPTADSLLHQGITSAMVGQCGLSPAPLLEETRREVIGALGGFFSGVAQSLPWDEWNSFEDFLGFLTHRGVSLNVLPLVGQGVIRASVMGFSEGRANKDQMDKMKAELSKALDQGAIGLNTGLIYPPGSFTSTEELIELTRIVGDRNGFYFSRSLSLPRRQHPPGNLAAGMGPRRRLRRDAETAG